MARVARLIPILIPLNRLYRDAESSDLLSVVRNTIPKPLRHQCPPRFFEKLLEGGDAVMLLDGLDEIASPDQRLRAATEIAALSNATPSTTRWILTSRIVGYKPKLQEHSFQLATVQHLTTEQVEQFVMNWYASRCESMGYPPDEIDYQRQVHARRAQHLVDTLESNVGLRSLATNPMLVSLITMLHSIRLELPENRALLYRDCVELLTGRWDTDRGVPGDESGLPISTPQKIAFLTALAWRMQSEKRREIRESEVEILLLEHLAKIVPTVTRDGARKFIDVLLERSGILMLRGTSASGDRLLAFSHLSFQEYLASSWLHALPHEEGDAFVLEHYMESWWREVILMRMAQVEFPLELTTRIYDRARNQGRLEGLIFAGYSLAEVQADRCNSIFRKVASDLAFIVSAGNVFEIATELLAADRNNLFLRYLIAAVEDIVRLRVDAAMALFHARLGHTVPVEAIQRTVAELSGRGDLANFDRELVLAAPGWGVPFEFALQVATRFPGAAELLLERRKDVPTAGSVAVRDGRWDDRIRLFSREAVKKDSERCIRRRAEANLTRSDAISQGDAFLRTLSTADQIGADLAIHMALYGAPFAFSEPLLWEIYERQPAMRRSVVNALLLQTPQSGGIGMRMLMSFVREVRGDRFADARRRCLALRCLEVIHYNPPYPVGFINFVLDSLRGSVDEREFALSVLWRLRGMDAEALAHCVAAAQSESKPDYRWGAVLALAGAREHLDDAMLRALLAQLYEREHRMQEHSLRDIAAYSLLRLAAA